MLKPTITYTEVERIARHGSPMLLQAIGRAFGIGPAERAALGNSGGAIFPTWTWIVAALGVGFVVGSRVQKRFPDKVPRLIQG